MIIIDSSLWIEYFTDSEFSSLVDNLLMHPNQIIVPTIIITEIYKKLLSSLNEQVAKDYIAQFQEFKVINLDLQIAMAASKFGKDFKLPLADSIIYATAMIFDAEIYTLDKHFEGLPKVKYFEKKFD